MSGDIKGPGSDYYMHMDPAEYAKRINTPAKNPEYFRRFHQPLIENAKKQFGTTVKVLDMAAGPADEMDFMFDDKPIFEIDEMHEPCKSGYCE